MSQQARDHVVSYTKEIERKDLIDIAAIVDQVLKTKGEAVLNEFRRKTEALVVSSSGWEKLVDPELDELQKTIARLNSKCKT